MRVIVIGRTEILYETIELLIAKGHTVPLIITCKEAPEYTRGISDFMTLADKIGSGFLQTAKVNDAEVVRSIKSMQPDICVSVNYSGIFSQEVIDIFPHGILNAHGGDLPRFRGNACQAWAILNGEKKCGLCVYKMKGDILDAGKIILREYLDIDEATTVGMIWKWMSRQIPGMFLEAINLLNEKPEFFIEDSTESKIPAIRCYPRLPEDGLINWGNKNIDIVRLVNATSEPYGGAFTFYENKRIIIWKAVIKVDEEAFLGVPGQVAAINDDGTIDVICGYGKINIQHIETPDGVRCLPTLIIKSTRKRFV